MKCSPGKVTVLFLLVNYALAQTDVTWTSTGSTTFSAAANWTDGVAPADDLTANIAVFGALKNAANPILTVSQRVAGLKFTGTGSDIKSYTFSSINNATLTLGSGGIIAEMQARSQTIDIPLILGGNQTWAASATNASLVVHGTVDLRNYVLTLRSGGDSGTTSNVTVSGIISGQGSIVKIGGSPLTLMGANTYAGGTTLIAGTLQINNGGDGSASSVGTGLLTIAGGAIDNTSGSSITLSTNNAQNWNGNFSFIGSNDLNLGTGTITLGANSTVTIQSSTLTIGGAISGSGFGLTKKGNGTLTLAGANSYTGATTITAGTLSVNTLANGGAASGIGASSNNASNLTIDGGTLQYTGIATTTDRKIRIASSATVDASGSGALIFTATGASAFTYGTSNQARTLTLSGSNKDNNTLSGLLSDNGSGKTNLVKEGLGTWILTGANTYTGGTTIDAGTLVAAHASALGTGGVIVNTTGTLSLADITLNNQLAFHGGTLAGSGTLAGTLSGAATITGSLNLDGGAVYEWDDGSPLSVSGSGAQLLLTDATLLLTHLTPDDSIEWKQDHSWVVATAHDGAAIIGSFAAIQTNGSWSSDLGSFGAALDGNTLSLTWTAGSAIPEPSAYAALLGLATLLGVAIRRRRRLAAAGT